MKKFTVRYAHADAIYVKAGDILDYGDRIILEGNTGQSTGSHLHVDCVAGHRIMPWYTQDYRDGDVIFGVDEARQLSLILTADLYQKGGSGEFHVKNGLQDIHKNGFRVTSFIFDPVYEALFGRPHYGFDTVGIASKTIYWNRSCQAKVLAVHHTAGYGSSVHLAINA